MGQFPGVAGTRSWGEVVLYVSAGNLFVDDRSAKLYDREATRAYIGAAGTADEKGMAMNEAGVFYMKKNMTFDCHEALMLNPKSEKRHSFPTLAQLGLRPIMPELEQ